MHVIMKLKRLEYTVKLYVVDSEQQGLSRLPYGTPEHRSNLLGVTFWERYDSNQR